MNSDLTATPFVLDPSNSVKHADRNTGADTDAGSNPLRPQAPDGYVAKQARGHCEPPPSGPLNQKGHAPKPLHCVSAIDSHPTTPPGWCSIRSPTR